MRLIARGIVVGTEQRPYTARNGQQQTAYAFFIRAEGDTGRYAADKIECPPERLPTEGALVEAVVNVKARQFGDREPFVSAWCTDLRTLSPAGRTLAVLGFDADEGDSQAV